MKKPINQILHRIALLQKLLLGSPVGNLNSIGAQFRVDGDDVHFLFSEESTLHYTHSLENIKLIVMRTYFPADDRFVYIRSEERRVGKEC